MGSKTYIITGLIFCLIFTLLFPPNLALGDHGYVDGGEPPDCEGGCCDGKCCKKSCCADCCSECCDSGGGPPGGGPPGGGPPGGRPRQRGRATGATGGDPVFMRNGEYRLYATDVYIRSRSLPVEITRTYGSRREYNSRFGYGWDINYNLKVRRLFADEGEPNAVVLLNGKGCRFEYIQDVNDDPNIYVNLKYPSQFFDYDDVNDTFTLVKKNGVEYSFDTSDKLSSITDENGNSIIFGYEQDEYGDALLPVYGPSEFFLEEEFGGPSGGRGLVAMAYKLTTITDDLERQISLSYNDDGLLQTITDFADRTWKYYYDPNTNDLLAVTGPNTVDYPSGLTTTYYYDTDDPNNKHNLEYVYDANGQQVVGNYYDIEDKVWKQDVGDGSYEFDYDDANDTVMITDRQDVNTQMVYNDTGLLLSETVYTADANDDPNSFTLEYSYDPNTMKRTRVVYPAGKCIDYIYTSLGNIIGIYGKTSTDEPNDPNDPNVIAALYTYHQNYKVKTITDPRGNVTSYDYNEVTGNLEKITYPTVTTPDGEQAPVESFTYNSYGQMETVTAADGIVTKYQYYDDANDPNYGKLWKVIADYNETDGLNITTEYSYDALGNVVTETDPNGDTTQFAYNELDQLVRTIAPLPFEYVTDISYDKNGNRAEMEREIAGPNQITSFTYYVRNKLKTMTDPLGNITTYGYNKNEEPNLVTDAEINSTLSEYNERGLLAKVTDANGGITEYSYDENGNLAEINDPNGNITSYIYNGFDRLIKITYPDDTNEVFSYDKNSNITSKTNRRGETIYYEYDAMNRMVVKNRPGDPNITYLYDIAGRPVDVNDGRAVTEGGGLTEYYYDRIGRVTDVVNPDEKTVSYEYDERGLRTKLDHPGPGYTTYKYDALGRLTQVKHSNTNLGNNGVLAEYTYDELSRRALLTLGNDANVVYEYDLANRLKKLTNNLDDTNSIVFDYSDYDKVGNRLSMKIDDANAHVYEYDNLYQLTSVDYNDGNTTDYYYDCLGNRTSVVNGGTTAYVLNDKGLNQYGSVGGVSYSYDDNGNLTDDGTYLYYYDCENRLTDVNNANDEPVISYKYDFAGRRMRKIVHGSPDVITKYCYDGDQVIVEYNDSNFALRRFFYGPGIDEPVCMQRTAAGGGAGVFYYHYDGLGSVVAISDANGVIVEKYEYDVFGEPNTTSSVGNPYLFTGRRYDSEAGLYYYRARYYSPAIGRFLQPDPIEYEDGLNLYTYVLNNPINVTDPMGTIASCSPHRPVGNPTFCRGGFFDSVLHGGLECYREVVGSGESGNQCCYSSSGEFCEQSPDRTGPATGGGGGSCENNNICNVIDHILDDVIGLNPIPSSEWPSAPPRGSSCPPG